MQDNSITAADVARASVGRGSEAKTRPERFLRQSLVSSEIGWGRVNSRPFSGRKEQSVAPEKEHAQDPRFVVD